jgi:hypothetical protein
MRGEMADETIPSNGEPGTKEAEALAAGLGIRHRAAIVDRPGSS